jgi:hypothetical protein
MTTLTIFFLVSLIIVLVKGKGPALLRIISGKKIGLFFALWQKNLRQTILKLTPTPIRNLCEKLHKKIRALIPAAA